MAKYKECPECSNCEEGTKIYQCNECKGRFCDDCKGEKDFAEEFADAVPRVVTIGFLGEDIICPHCGEKSMHHTIKCTIDSDDDDNDDDDE